MKVKVIKVLEKVTLENADQIPFSDFTKKGKPVEKTLKTMSEERFKDWAEDKIDVSRQKDFSLKARIRIMNKLLKLGKIIYYGEPFEIEL